MSSKQSTTPASTAAPQALTLVFANKPAALHLDEQCAHRTTAEKAGQPGYSKEPTVFRAATEEELKSLKPCRSCQARAEKAAKARRKCRSRSASPCHARRPSSRRRLPSRRWSRSPHDAHVVALQARPP